MRQLKRSLFVFVWLSLICGLAYPLAMTGIAQILYPDQSSASLIRKGETPIGSRLIGQQFDSAEYFHGRPSALNPPYDASNSGGSNLAPSSAKLIAQARDRVRQVRETNGLPDDSPVPADLALTSASGLDPHISPAAAMLQARRVAGQRRTSPADIDQLIKQNTEQPLLGIWGKERVNVLALNLALDAMKTGH